MSLIVKRHHRLPAGVLLRAGDELAPGLLDPASVDQLIDQGILVEVPTRLSYFALLPDFAGADRAKFATAANLADVFPGLVIPKPLDVRAGKE
jgi:hypothetical protein